MSIGVVDETGREFYAVSTEFDPDRAIPWVRRNVLDQLPSPADKAWRSRQRIREDLFVLPHRAGRGGRAVGLVRRLRPRRPGPAVGRDAGVAAVIPRFTRELRQRWEDVGRPEFPPKPTGTHDALVDARYNLARWKLMEAARR